MEKIKSLLLWTCLVMPCMLLAQQPVVSMVYKTIDSTSLKLNIFYPDNHVKGKKQPAIILFPGGGWISESMGQMEPQARHFARNGMIAITADYRVRDVQKTTPFEAVMDAKSAIRFLRGKASALDIDPDKIAAGGGSAGGHIAAAADLTTLDEKGEDMRISSRPNALVLFNPVFNNGPGEYGYDRIGDRFKEISPYHNIKPGAAPTIAFFGSEDQAVHTAKAKLYKKTMEENGNRCDLFIYPGQKHGFFNFRETGDNTYFDLTLQEADAFLKSLGYIN